MDRRTNGWTDIRMDGQTDGQTDRQTLFSLPSKPRNSFMFTSLKDDHCIELNSSCYFLAEFSMETQAFECSG